LKIKLSSLGKEELELVFPYAILQNEQLAFLRLAEQAKSNPAFSGFLPPSIKTQRGIVEQRAPIENAPVSQLESRLMPFDGRKGEYLITFQRPWGDFAHSLYIDFQTRRFCDVMDSRFKTFFAKERFFGTHEEMLSELTSYTSSTYQGKYLLFSLWHYEKTP
jgi:hypothetical protein